MDGLTTEWKPSKAPFCIGKGRAIYFTLSTIYMYFAPSIRGQDIYETLYHICRK